MEFDENLTKLQGTLSSLGFQNLLNKPDTIDKVVESLKLLMINLPDNTKSKLMFYMVLNSDLSISEQLKQDDFVGFFISTTPQITKEYLIIYAYHLNLQPHLFKVIENCPGAIGLELLDELIKILEQSSFHKDIFGVEHIYQLWQSVFVKICKLETGLHKDKCSKKFVTQFMHIYNFIKTILLVSMNVGGLEKFVGTHLYYFFKTLLFFFKIQKSKNLTDDLMYNLSIKLKEDSENGDFDFMAVCLNKILASMSDILENLTVDLWIVFSEYYFDSDTKSSFQVLIGDLVHHILEEVEREQVYEVPSVVLSGLSNVAIKKSDPFEKAGIDEIISYVRDGDKDGFKALIRHFDVFKKKSVECLLDALHLATAEDLNVILNNSYEYLCSFKQSENLDLVKKLFLAAMKKSPDCTKWIEKIFEKYRPDLLATAETQKELTEAFNKISKDRNISDCDLISLCMQSPVETIKKICKIAVYGSGKTEFVFEFFKLLQCPCKKPLSEDFTILDFVLIKSLLEELTEKEKQSFINLIVRLKKEDLLGSLFVNNLLKTVKEYLEIGKFEKAVQCLEVLRTVVSLKNFEVDKVVFLVFMSQVLEYLSWDLENFSITKANGRGVAASIVVFILSDLEENEYGASLQWAREEILKLSVLNQAYFCDLWFKFDSVWCGSGDFHCCILAMVHSSYKSHDIRNFVINFDEPFEIRTSVILSLFLLLPSFTSFEWISIFDHLIIIWRNINSEKENTDVYHDVLDLFGSALHFVILCTKTKEKTYPCFKYCLRNFGKLAKRCVPEMRKGSLFQIFEKIFVIIGVIENEEKRKTCWEILVPLLIELVDCLIKGNVETHGNEIKKLLPFLDLKNVAEVILKKLQ